MTDVHSPALDAGAFAERLLGAPLWGHQLELVRSPARYRVVCAGRQAGKSRTLAVMALHAAATQRNAMVLLVSAGEQASRRLLEECAALASASDLLRGSVVDESRSRLVLSNGSQVLSVPASQRQIRGWAVDLLIVDEAAFIDPEIWRAAEPSIVARPGSRVVLCSTPWGSPDHFFRVLWRRGMDAPDGMVAGFHWPSSVSPLVDAQLVEHWRETWPALTFTTEVLAEWADGAGAYFTTAELEAATADLEPVDLASASGLGRVVGGIDWGMRNDANTLCVLRARGFTGSGEPVLEAAHVEEHFSLPYSAWIDRLVEVSRGAGARPAEGFWWARLVCESNGVGQMPAEVLSGRLGAFGLGGVVAPVTTTARLKEDAFGAIKVLLNTGRLVLPRNPSLLKQLRALEFEQLPGGGVRLAVPDRAGHDDVAMSLALAVVAVGEVHKGVSQRTTGIVGLD